MELSAEQFGRQKYTVDGSALDAAKRIQLIVQVDGRDVVRMALPEPGMIALVSKPDESGFDVEVVSLKGSNLARRVAPSNGGDDSALATWQRQAMGFEP